MSRACGKSGRWALFAGVFLALVAAAWADDKPPEKVRLRGLLVGVSHYDHLPDADLDGPVNDLPLLVDVLSSRFPAGSVRLSVLSEAAGKDDAKLRPTKAHIERELAKLAADAQPGEQIVIYLSGHGTQQPADTNDDLEADGLDEVFLPADAERSETSQAVPNGLTDDELRKALQAVAAKGAAVWFIADCCHSGTIARGLETPRRLSPSKLFSPAVAAEIERRRQSPAALAPSKPDDESGLPAGVVALYASQSHRPTVERYFPSVTEPGKRATYGLLSYNLIKILRREAGRRLTYRELAQRLQEEYVALGYVAYPAPLIEGAILNRAVLGDEIYESAATWKLARAGDMWTIPAGQFQGLTKGSILAVYPADGLMDVRRLGHVVVQNAWATSAEVVPCPYEEGAKTWPAVREFPADARCAIVFAHYGDLRLTVAADDPADGTSQPSRQTLAALLTKLKSERELPMQVIDDHRAADWRMVADHSRVFLSPAQGDLEPGATGTSSPRLGGFAPAELPLVLPETLRRIARAELLRKIAAIRPAGKGAAAVAVGVEILKFKDENDQVGQPIETVASRPRLAAGEIVGFRVTNRSKNATLYVTLLAIDSGRGISAIYPDVERGHVAEAIQKGESFGTRAFRVRHDGLGVESLVALAVKANGPPVDFTSLVQPTLAQAQQVSRTRAASGAGSALAELLQGALFATPTTRGLDSVETEQCAAAILTWETAPENTNPKR